MYIPRRTMKLVCIVTSLLLFGFCLSEICHDHAGKEFIIIPVTIATSEEVFQVHVSSHPTQTTSGTIHTPLLPVNSNSKLFTPFSISPTNRLSINIQNFENVPVNQINYAAIIINTTQDVVVTVSQGKTDSLGGMLIFPTESLGVDYRIVTYSPMPPSTDKAVLIIAAAHPDTEVQLFPGSEQVALEIDGIIHGGNEIVQLQLAKYESIVVASSEDLTGVRVLATKPVAVYSGNLALSIYNDGESDAALEQIPPVSELGTSHIVISNPKVEKDHVKVVSTVDNNQVYISNVTYHIALAGGFLLRHFASTGIETSLVISSLYPVLVAIYGDEGPNSEGVDSDVTMTIVPPIKSYGNSFTFLPPVDSLPVTYVHYLVIISPQGYSGDLRLDGVANLDLLTWTPVTIDDGTVYEFVSLEVPNSLHVLESITDTHAFGGYLYGTAEAQSYGIGLAAYTQTTWTIQSPNFVTDFSKFADDKLPFSPELNLQTTRSTLSCYQMCSLSSTCGVVAVYPQSPTSVECRFYEAETFCGPFQNVTGYKLFVRQK